MKKLILFAALLMIAAAVSAQNKFTVKGIVVDSATRQPLAGASVFAQNTTQGTVSNAEGSFILSLANGGYELVFSYTGYETRSLRVSNSQALSDSLVIELPQIDRSLEAVAIVVTNEVENGWERFGSFFFDNFIGTTPNAADCIIENPDSLRFFYTKNKKRHRLKVTSNQDLLIRNNALGYLIRYQLDSFSYDYNSGISHYTGYPFFIELDTTEEVKKEWVQNRARSYLGSRLHFMSSMYDSVVYEEGFSIEQIGTGGARDSLIRNPYDSSIYEADSTGVNVYWNGKYRISYKSVLPHKKFLQEYKLPANTRAQVTLLNVTDGFVIEENGFFYEQYDVINTGYWGWKKLAEALPYDYNYE